MKRNKCASLAGILLSEWRSALVMNKAGFPLERIPWQHRLVGSAGLVPNHYCGEHFDEQNSAKFATSTFYRASQRPAPYGGTILVKPYERLIKQIQPINWSANRWMDHPGNDIHADALQEKTQPGR